MNLSSVSVYENVSPLKNFSRSGVYRTINDLLNINGDVKVKLFCPLCVNSFEFKFSLFEHLRTFHSSFLIQAGNQNLKFKECPFCNAKFYGKHLTAKHVFAHHPIIVKELFINKNRSCLFCHMKLNGRDSGSVMQHIEELHFLEFEEEFRKTFSCEAFLEMTISELVNSYSSVQDEKSQCWEDVCMDVGNKGTKKIPKTSDVVDFSKANKINCFDFTDLKEQLENINNCGKKSILKDVVNAVHSPKLRKSARRVLRFDLPHEGDKENSVLNKNLETFKNISINSHGLLHHDKKAEIDNILTMASSETLCGEPQHSSTPNKSVNKLKPKILVKDEKKGIKIKENFKSYLEQKNTMDFEFQCGKCQKLFKENIELVFHIKNNHNKFHLNVLQPCYRCAICNARFYKNYYLKKHHGLHKPY